MSNELLELPQIDPIEDVDDDKDNINNSCDKRNNESDTESESCSKPNLKHFRDDLIDKPEIFAFIIRQGKRIRRLQKKLKKLKGSIKKLRPKVKHKDAFTQTPADISEEIIKVEDVPKSFTEEIKEAAENAMLKTGFVYEPTSGMYYDYNTGYYYNAELGLYYDGNSGIYMVYNNETKTYDFHSQVSVVKIPEPEKEENGVKRKKQHKDQDGKRAKIKTDKKEKKDQTNLEEGECSESEKDSNSEISCESSDEPDIIEIAQSWPPCMRIILKETTIEKLKIGSLYIITCDGGQIGREGEKSVLIPDINVSKTHAEIIYDKEQGKYMITDLGSQNGTILNGKRISAAKQISDPQPVVHGSIIQFGTTKLLCHIHDGQQTCGHCEPGLIQIEKPAQILEVEKTAKKSTQYKKELRRLRKKFGLENFQDSDGNLAAGYSDRAEERRKKVGSHDDSEKTKVASVHESIAADNKGFKMLAKMGWTEGQALGKDGTGLTEPVALVSNEGTTGLGSAVPAPSDSLKQGPKNRKASVWKKAQQRYQKVQDVTLEAFKESSDEAET